MCCMARGERRKDCARHGNSGNPCQRNCAETSRGIGEAKSFSGDPRMGDAPGRESRPLDGTHRWAADVWKGKSNCCLVARRAVELEFGQMLGVRGQRN